MENAQFGNRKNTTLRQNSTSIEHFLDRISSLPDDILIPPLTSFFEKTECSSTEVIDFWKAWKKASRNTSSFADKEIKTESFPIDLTRELSFNYEDIIKLERNYDRALVQLPLVLELPNNLVKTIACHSCNTIHVQNLKKTMYMLASKTTDEVLLRSTGLPIVTKKKDKSQNILWGNKRSPQIRGSPFFPVSTLTGRMVDVKYGELVRKANAKSLNETTKYIGIGVLCKDVGTSSNIWNCYSYLSELDRGMVNSPRFFPQVHSAERTTFADGQPYTSFTLECPDAVSLISLLGPALAEALRSNYDILAVWCRQLEEARREVLRCERFVLQTPSLHDVFVRANGTLILGNMMVSPRKPKKSMKKYVSIAELEFVTFMHSVLSAALGVSRTDYVNIRDLFYWESKVHDSNICSHVGSSLLGHRDDDDCGVIELSVGEGHVLKIVCACAAQEVAPRFQPRCSTKRAFACPTVFLVETELHNALLEIPESLECQEGDILIVFGAADKKVGTPQLYGTQSLTKKYSSHDCNSIEDGKIYLEFIGSAAGTSSFDLYRAGSDHCNLTKFAVIRLDVISYAVCSHPDIEELLCLLHLDSSGFGGDPSRLLGANMLTKYNQASHSESDIVDNGSSWADMLATVIMSPSKDVHYDQNAQKYLDHGILSEKGAYLKSSARKTTLR